MVSSVSYMSPCSLDEMETTDREVHPQANLGWRHFFVAASETQPTAQHGHPTDIVFNWHMSSYRSEPWGDSRHQLLTITQNPGQQTWVSGLWAESFKLTEKETSLCSGINVFFRELQSELFIEWTEQLLNHRAMINSSFKCPFVLRSIIC